MYTLVVRSIPKCVYCDAAKRLLDRQDIPYDMFEYNNVLEYVKNINYRTIPMVFESEAGGVEAITEENLIGGYEQLQAIVYK